MKTTFRLIFFISFELFISPIYAQKSPSVYGRIVDFQGESIQGASVVIENTEPIKGSLSDINGYFEISNVPLGKQQLIISYVGYKTQVFIFDIILGKRLQVNVKLLEDINQLDQVEVVTSYFGKPNNTMSLLSGRSISPEEAKNFAGGYNDISRVASSFAGVTETGDGFNSLIIRGNNPRGTLWRLNGIEIPSPSHFNFQGNTGGAISALSVHVLDNTDFMTGSFPAEYGNALSGVFDVKFRNGNHLNHERTFQFGALGIDLAFEGPINRLKKSSFLTNYRYSTLALLDQMGIVSNGDLSQNYQDLSFHLKLPQNARLDLDVFGLLTQSRESGMPDINEEKDLSFSTGNLGLQLNQSFSKSFKIENTSIVSWTSNEIEEKEILNDSLTVFFSDAKIDNLFLRNKMVFDYCNSRFNIRVGSTYTFTSYSFLDRFPVLVTPDSSRIFTFFDDSGSASILNSFLTFKYTTKRFDFVGGIHSSFFTLNQKSTIEPRLSIRYYLNDNNNLTLSFTEHSRIESLEYYLAEFETEDGDRVQFNRNLDFSRARHFGLSWYQDLWGIDLDVELYFQYLYNIPVNIDVNSDIWSSLIQPDRFVNFPLSNDGTGRNYGIEITFKKNWENKYLLLTGSVFNALYTPATGEEINSLYNGNFNFNFLTGGQISKNEAKGKRREIHLKVTYNGNQRFVPIDLEESKEQNRTAYNFRQAYEQRYPNYFRADFQFVFRKDNAKTGSAPY